VYSYSDGYTVTVMVIQLQSCSHIWYHSYNTVAEVITIQS